MARRGSNPPGGRRTEDDRRRTTDDGRPTAGLHRSSSVRRPTATLVLLLTAGALLGAAARPVRTAPGARESGRSVDWPNVGNDKGGMRYSTLRQINRENVEDLQVAWTYRTGAERVRGNIQCTPVVVDGVMYLTNDRIQVVA